MLHRNVRSPSIMSGSCSAVAKRQLVPLGSPPMCPHLPLFKQSIHPLPSSLCFCLFIALCCRCGEENILKKGERVMSSSYYEGSEWEAHFPPKKKDLPVPVLTLCPTSSPLQLNPPPPPPGRLYGCHHLFQV